MTNPTESDVSVAQSFDVAAFLNNVVNRAADVATARTQQSQNTMTPGVSTDPSRGGATVPGSQRNTLLLIGLGVAAAVGLILILKRKG